MGEGLSPQSAGQVWVTELAKPLYVPPQRSLLAACLRRGVTSLPFHLLLFLLTLLTTLVVGAHIGLNYARNLPAFDWDLTRVFFSDLVQHPSQLVLGLPFSLTLLSILLAHELAHYFTCRHYGIRATYPYFLPAPTLIGTLGAFIRIKSPIVSRRALFDVGISGPIVGFLVALPALAAAIVFSHATTLPQDSPGTITLGNPLALVLLTKLLRPGMNPAEISLHPIGCAAWVGLFATALNLLPTSQLDGGHIVYALCGERHKAVSKGFWLALVPLGVYCWMGWIVWAVLLLFVGLRHPVVLAPADSLGRGRKLLALAAGIVFILCFVPTPLAVH